MAIVMFQHLALSGSGPASWQQLKCAGETWTNADRAEIAAICRENAVHVSSLGNGDDRPIDQSQVQPLESGVELRREDTPSPRISPPVSTAFVLDRSCLAN